MEETKWIIKTNEKPKDTKELIKILLKNRLKDENSIEEFITPKHPKEFIETDKEFIEVKKHADNAARMIKDAIKNNEKIVVYGDYDVDGVTSTAIMWRTIHNNLKYKNVEPFIPNRFEDGYGLSKKVIEALAEMDTKLIVTVDCGVVSVEEVEYAKRLGIKIIISDHHEPDSKIPNADEIVHSTNATGAGIAWIISNSLINNEDTHFLGLAAMGTIADLQPLLGFNRSIVYHGLKNLNENPPIGVKKLLIFAGIENIEIDTYHVGWQIGPRINATGRIDNAIDSLRLLCTDSISQANKLAEAINEINKTRQVQTLDGQTLAIEELDEDNIPPIIITASENYHDGIIGLVAGRLMQTYNRPAIAIAIDAKNKVGKGSARSIKQVNLIETLRNHKDLFQKLGGHTMAAGFSIDLDNIETLKQHLYKDLENQTFQKEINIDLNLPAELITEDTVNAINRLKPFGVGNNSPIFTSSDMSIYNYTTFGKENNHLKLFLTKDNKNITAVGFGLGKLFNDLEANQKIELAYQIVVNEWNDQKSVELRIKDIKTKKDKDQVN